MKRTQKNSFAFSLIAIAFILAFAYYMRDRHWSPRNNTVPMAHHNKEDLEDNEEALRGPAMLTEKRLSTLHSMRAVIFTEHVVRWRDGHISKENLKAHFTYWNPRRMLFEFETIAGPHGFYAKGDRVIVWPSLNSGQRYDTLQSIEETLYQFAGVSRRSSVYLPGILLRVHFHSSASFLLDGDILKDLNDNGHISGVELCAGQECRILERRRDDVTIKVWIDNKDELIRRIVESADERQKDWQRAHGGAGISGNIVSSVGTFDIQDIECDLPFADELGHIPAEVR